MPIRRSSWDTRSAKRWTGEWQPDTNLEAVAEGLRINWAWWPRAKHWVENEKLEVLLGERPKNAPRFAYWDAMNLRPPGAEFRSAAPVEAVKQLLKEACQEKRDVTLAGWDELIQELTEWRERYARELLPLLPQTPEDDLL